MSEIYLKLVLNLYVSEAFEIMSISSKDTSNYINKKLAVRFRFEINRSTGFPNINCFKELMYREHKKLVTARSTEWPVYKVFFSLSDKYHCKAFSLDSNYIFLFFSFFEIELGESGVYLTPCRFLFFCETPASLLLLLNFWSKILIKIYILQNAFFLFSLFPLWEEVNILVETNQFHNNITVFMTTKVLLLISSFFCCMRMRKNKSFLNFLTN